MRTRCVFLLAAFLIAVPSRAAEHAQSKPAPAALASAFVDQVTAHFQDWDLDKNGTLSAGELDTAACSAKTVGGEAAAVAALKRAAGDAKRPLTVALTLDNIVKLSKTPPPPAEGPNLPKMYAEGLSRIDRADRVVMVSETPQLSTLHQGRLGDCFCLAPLGAMLNRDPKQVAGMYHVQAGGKCDVALGRKTFAVEMPTDTELALSASTKHDGVWVNLYEKAVGAARNEAKPESARSASPLDAVAHGGSAGTILALITGHEITRFSCAYFKEDGHCPDEKAFRLQQLREQLEEAMREKRLATCGTATTTTPGITPNHAYAVLDFDASADTVRLWNPHGTNFTPKDTPGLTAGYPRKDGVFSIPLTDFVQQFAGLAFERLPNTVP